VEPFYRVNDFPSLKDSDPDQTKQKAKDGRSHKRRERGKPIAETPYSPPPKKNQFNGKKWGFTVKPKLSGSASLLAPATQLLTPMSFNRTINPPFFPPAPQPLPLMTPSPNPFLNPLRTQTATPAHLAIAQTQTTKSLANLPYPTNPFIQTDTVRFTQVNIMKQNPKNVTRRENIQK
jgi:hypothetical protein